MRKQWAAVCSALALSVMLAIPAYAGTWRYENEQWKYQRGMNNFVYNDWVSDNGNRYYMGNDGYMKTGWQQIGNQWYYMDETGIMQTGWLQDQYKWYFLYPNGAMAVNTVIDGHQIGADGAWEPAEGEAEPSNVTDLSTAYLVQNMEGISTRGYSILGSARTSQGDRWNNAIRLNTKSAYIKIPADGQYRLLFGQYGPGSQFSSAIMARFTVYGDNDQVLYTSPDIHYNEKNNVFGVDVSGQSAVRVEVSLAVDNNWDEPQLLFDGLALYK